jgi:uncharacterized protein (TIGR00297 family)
MHFVSFLTKPIHLYCFFIILLSTLLIEWAIKKNRISVFLGRKLLHIIAICSCAYCIQYTTNRFYLSYIFLAFGGLLTLLVAKKYFAASQKGSYGIALFPFAFFILLQCRFLQLPQIVFAVLTLALADAAAGLVGFYWSKKKIVFLQEPKSWLGGYTFFVVSFLVYGFYFECTHLYLGILVALIPAIAELFSFKGSDNLSVPIVTAIWLYLLQNTEVTSITNNSIYATVIALLAVMAYYKKWLTISGAIAALLVGILVIFAAGIIYLLPLAIFLIAGSIASKLNKKDQEKNGRAAIQVFANGIVAIICILLFFITKIELFTTAFFASIAISMCDTMSSELGKYYKQNTYDIISFKKTTIGLSGGISIAGTMAGFVFCFLYSVAIYFIFHISIPHILLIFSIGFIGMLLDSVLGSTLQAKYLYSNAITEIKNEHKIKGFHWCTNDMVNVLANALTIGLFVALQLLLKN